MLMLRMSLLYGCLLVAGQLAAQSDSTTFSKLLAGYKIKTSIGLQLWSTYSQNMQVYDPETQTYLVADNRLNTQLRRSRFTISGHPYPLLNFKITAALDLVGHDVLAATEAGGNNGSSPNFRIWNAYVNVKLRPKGDHLYLTTGYFVVPIGRESNNAALRSTSFEKAWSQNYLRRQLTGIGPGRAMGIMLGGQFHNEAGTLHLTYEAAIQNPVFQAFGGNSTGTQWSPLVTTRLSVHVGDAENQTYSLDHKVNYFGKRTGLTLSLARASQGRTASFSRNGAYGMEILLNSPEFHLDGEYLVLQRSDDGVGANATIESFTGYLRIGKNFSLRKQRVLEPVVSYWFFRGPETIDEINTSSAQAGFSGADSGLDIGGNFYFNPNFKLSLFYAQRAGDPGEGKPWLINNNFYQQSGVGAVKRGDYLGLGLAVTF